MATQRMPYVKIDHHRERENFYVQIINNICLDRFVSQCTTKNDFILQHNH